MLMGWKWKILAICLAVWVPLSICGSAAAQAALDKAIADAGVKTWGELFYLKQDQFDNPDRPVLTAWVAKNRYSEQIFIMERNPYYMGVDQEGNQLPA